MALLYETKVVCKGRGGWGGVPAAALCDTLTEITAGTRQAGSGTG